MTSFPGSLKSAGSDNLHPKVLKEFTEEIPGPLIFIFSIYGNPRKFPEDWKNICCSNNRKTEAKRENPSYYRQYTQQV